MRVRLTGSFVLVGKRDAVLPLFTAEGERRWAPTGTGLGRRIAPARGRRGLDYSRSPAHNLGHGRHGRDPRVRAGGTGLHEVGLDSVASGDTPSTESWLRSSGTSWGVRIRGEEARGAELR
jgi:hypothetical protein